MKKRNLIITFLALVMLVSSVTLVFADDKEGDKTVKPKVEKIFSCLYKNEKNTPSHLSRGFVYY